ncbi:UbiA family prenyltransferase [Candidatus Woesearchaeota archaeon]|nr:UbiA family prenyltransferase [Candidatus Woesearchaeota archaeon]
MSLRSYLALIRFYSHPTYLVIIVVAIYFSGLSIETAKMLGILYLSFNVFLYGGLYTMNSIADIESDRMHPKKSKRPLPSGEITVTAAWIFATAMTLIGLVTGYLLFGPKASYVYLAFVILNVLYTYWLKHIPYVELMGNTLTHPLRLVLALILFNHGNVPVPLVSGYFFTILGTACVRRIVEKDVKGWEARKVLKHYTLRQLVTVQVLSFVLLLMSIVAGNFSHAPLFLIMLAFYIILVFGVYLLKPVRAYWVAVFTR